MGEEKGRRGGGAICGIGGDRGEEGEGGVGSGGRSEVVNKGI